LAAKRIPFAKLGKTLDAIRAAMPQAAILDISSQNAVAVSRSPYFSKSEDI